MGDFVEDNCSESRCKLYVSPANGSRTGYSAGLFVVAIVAVATVALVSRQRTKKQKDSTRLAEKFTSILYRNEDTSSSLPLLLLAVQLHRKSIYRLCIVRSSSLRLEWSSCRQHKESLHNPHTYLIPHNSILVYSPCAKWPFIFFLVMLDAFFAVAVTRAVFLWARAIRGRHYTS